jgi:hypothetical protein
MICLTYRIIRCVPSRRARTPPLTTASVTTQRLTTMIERTRRTALPGQYEIGASVVKR